VEDVVAHAAAQARERAHDGGDRAVHAVAPRELGARHGAHARDRGEAATEGRGGWW
jgi:hypothetical protein